jgi:hypothetical protein
VFRAASLNGAEQKTALPEFSRNLCEVYVKVLKECG